MTSVNDCILTILPWSFVYVRQNKDGSFEMDFTVGGLVGALVANVFAAFKGNESKKLLESDPALKGRIGGTGNQFAIMTM